jgi:hypothetical protein
LLGHTFSGDRGPTHLLLPLFYFQDTRGTEHGLKPLELYKLIVSGICYSNGKRTKTSVPMTLGQGFSCIVIICVPDSNP